MKILIFCVFFVFSSHCHEVSDYIPTTSEHLPFQAVLFNHKFDWYTVGALISPKCVIAMANAIKESTNITVYLGFSRNPKVEASHQDEGVQIIAAEKILLHEDFGQVNSSGVYIYDLGLVFLESPASMSQTVQLVALPPKNFFPIKAGTFANVTAFSLFNESGSPAYATVKMRSQSKCKLFFGVTFIDSEEICVQQKVANEPNSSFVNLPLVLGGKLIGLGRTLLASAVCQVTSATCNPVQVYTSLENSLEWITENADIPSLSHENLDNQSLDRISEAELASNPEERKDVNVTELGHEAKVNETNAPTDFSFRQAVIVDSGEDQDDKANTTSQNEKDLNETSGSPIGQTEQDQNSTKSPEEQGMEGFNLRLGVILDESSENAANKTTQDQNVNQTSTDSPDQEGVANPSQPLDGTTENPNGENATQINETQNSQNSNETSADPQNINGTSEQNLNQTSDNPPEDKEGTSPELRQSKDLNEAPDNLPVQEAESNQGTSESPPDQNTTVEVKDNET